MKCKYLEISVLFVSTSIFLSIPAFAELPFITDDPDTVKFQHSEIFLFSSYLRNKDGAETFSPAMQWNYGLWPNLEFSILSSVLTVSPRNNEEPKESGFTDIELELKYQFWEETKYRLSAAIVPTYIISTGSASRGLGNGRGWYLLPVWIQKTWDKWTAYGGGGYAFNSAIEQNNFLFGGVVVQRELNDKWTVGGEIYSQGAASVDAKSYTFFNLGAYYYFTEKFSLLFSVGNNMTGASNFIAFLGLSWAFEPNRCFNGQNGLENYTP